jgi:hypothetical protein
MYQTFKNNTVQYILDYEPTEEQLQELNCDSYEEYIEPEESYDAKKIRVMASLIAQSDISLVDLEGVTFTNEEVGDIILKRVFGGNPHAQIALQSKYLGVLTKLIKKESLTSEDNDILSEAEDKRNKVNEGRAKFSLSDI